MKTVNLIVIGFLTLVLLSAAYALNQFGLSKQKNTHFSASGNCELCHGASDFALLDSQGNDVSPVSHWRSTMLANSSKDPFWKAKVKHEGISNPHHKDALENVCTRCHAPMGMVDAFLNNAPVYTLDSLKNDEMGQDGISCTVCHQIKDLDEDLFSGSFEINLSKEIYGPYVSPLTQQMNMNTGYTPVYNEIINESRLCGSCHTLITNSVDEHGDFTGETFVEQALYHEWENSVYSKQNTSCQSCHFPRINENIKISSRPGFVAGREPFGVHSLTGGNAFMLSLLKNNQEELASASGEEFLDETIQRTKEMLTQNTINLELNELSRTVDSVFVEISLKNKAGHKFPTGFPSRRAYLEFLVIANSDTLFHSGNKNAAALNHDDDKEFEPHYSKINDENQVQIFEFVMGDNEGKVTTLLERAYEPLKDNRIPPEGFSRSHLNYDTVRIVGEAIYDMDYFNGGGTEHIIYAFPISNIKSGVNIKALLHYETVPKSWLKDLFEYSTEDEDIFAFETMYSKMENTSEIVAIDSIQLILTEIDDINEVPIHVYPNPSSGKVYITGANEPMDYSIYSSYGVLIEKGLVKAKQKQIDFDLPSGQYPLVVNSSSKRFVFQLIIENY